MNQHTSRTALIRDHAKKKDGVAETLLADLLRDLFKVDAQNVAINYDQYSLNSLNGFFEDGEKRYFF